MLLPPNSTKQEREIVEAIDYKVDSSCIKGFKFNLKEEILPWLVEEYGLEEILFWVKDKKKAVTEGVKFQRLRGTLASLKIALKWANIEDISITEEPPGKHFFELQIGIKEVPNNFFVDAVVELAKLSLPARSRLMRIFNDYYNAQRFILDSSLFGDLLSDYSGIKIEKDGPVLSFGRKNSFEVKIPNSSFNFSTFRSRYERRFSNDLYRLDVAVLGETEPHTKNYSGIYERDHSWYNFKALYPLPQSLLPPIKFITSQVVLSDSWQLGDINNCFPVTTSKEEGRGFYLCSSKLSEEFWNFKYTPILERFSLTYQYEVKNFTDQRITRANLLDYHVSCKNDRNSEEKGSIHELENYIAVLYTGVVTWHEHKHLATPWRETQSIIIFNRFF